MLGTSEYIMPLYVIVLAGSTGWPSTVSRTSPNTSRSRPVAVTTRSAGNSTPVDLGASSFWPLTRLRDHAQDKAIPWWSLTSLVRDAELVDELDVALGEDRDVVRIGTREVQPYRGETEKALADLLKRTVPEKEASATRGTW